MLFLNIIIKFTVAELYNFSTECYNAGLQKLVEFYCEFIKSN